jgi:glycosyl transferase family 25
MSAARVQPDPAETRSLFNCFDRTYVLNLPERTDRRRDMDRELRGAGADGANDVRFFPAIRPAEACGFPSSGVFGCFQSHQAVLREALSDGVERLLVLEDDLTFSPQLGRLWPMVGSYLMQGEWELAYLGYDPRDVAGEVAEQPAEQVVGCHRPMHLAHFYAVHGSVLRELVEFLDVVRSREPGDPLGGPMHYDGALSTFRMQHPRVRTVRSTIPLGWQRPSRSDIAPNAWFDRVPGVSGVVGALRGIKGRMLRPEG